MYQSDNLCVCDTETGGRFDSAVIFSAAWCVANITKLHTFKELLDQTLVLKFDAAEQVKLGRTTCKSTLEWWANPEKVSDEARKFSYIPNPNRDVSIDTFADELTKYLHTRGIEGTSLDHCDRNLFDYSKLSHVVERRGLQRPWHYHDVFDVTSTLKAWGAPRYSDISVNDIDGFCYHRPDHDAVLDFLRIQYELARKGGIDIKPEDIIAASKVI